MKDQVPESVTDRPLRVLLVDDAVQVRRGLSGLLPVAVGVEIVGEAADGREALEKARLLQPDVVILDLAMPVMDGYAAARGLRSQGAACRLVALTVNCGEAERNAAFKAGFDAFVVKGAPLAELRAAITGGIAETLTCADNETHPIKSHSNGLLSGGAS